MEWRAKRGRLRAGTGIEKHGMPRGTLPEAALDFAYVSHGDDSTIGSNFCQALIAENAKCRMQNEETA
jgi:hypothetical protein